MSDRTHLQFTILDCPPAEREAVATILTDYGLGQEYGTMPAPITADDLELGEPYMDDEASVGTISDVASLLVERAPGATWYGWEDPKYEWLGNLYQYVPVLGLRSQACDADGNEVYTAKEVRDMIDGASDPDELDRMLGKEYDDAIAALTPVPATRDYAARVTELEAEGMTTSDAQAAADAERDDPKAAR